MTARLDQDAWDVAPSRPALWPEERRRAGVLGVVTRHSGLSIGVLILAVIAAIAILAPLLTTIDPLALAPTRRLRDPSAIAWFGTDMFGRDVYSRVVYGGRISLAVGAAVGFLAAAGGLLLGLAAGFSKRIDEIVMRALDGFMAIPPVLLAVALVSASGGSLLTVIAAIAVSEVPRAARLVRAMTLSLREQPYVLAAVASGTRTFVLVVRHVLPNTLPALVVQATYSCAGAMLAESMLSFIGAGIPPSIPSWGNIMAEGRALWQLKPFLIACPAVALSLSILSVNLIGDGLRDLLDPRVSGERR